MKIRTQLLVFILGVVLIGFCVVVVLSYTSSEETVLSEVYGRTENIKQKHQEFLNGYFRSAEKVSLGIAHAVEADSGMSKETVHKLLQENIIWNPEIYGSILYFEPSPEEAGKSIFAPYYFRQGQLLKHIPSEPTFKFEEQDWFAEPKKQARPVWAEPYFDAGTKTIMTTYSVPIYRDGKFIALSTVDISLESLAKKTNDIHIGKSGYAILVSRKGAFLAHPNQENYALKKNIQDVAAEAGAENTNFQELAKMMAQGRDGAVSLKDPLTGKKSWVTYGAIPATGYSLAIFIPEDELLSSVKQLSYKIFFISIVMTMILIAAIVGISWQITHPIRVLSQSARKIATGEMEIEIGGSDSKSEVGDLTRDIQTMVATIKKMISAVRREKEKFEQVFTTMSDGIAVSDSDWKIIDYNKAAGKMLGVSIGTHLIQHISDNFRSNFDLKDLLDQKRGQRFMELIRPESEQTGEMYYSGVINTIVDSEYRITAYIFTVRDVTGERKEELNKKSLLSMISHKLKTPITVLMGTASLFQDKILGDLNEKQAENVKKMIAQASKLQELVDRLISYVALNDAKSVPMSDIYIVPFISEFIEKQPWEFRGKIPNIDLKIDSGIGKWKINGEHLKIIISELIENAVKFNDKLVVEVKIRVGKMKDRLVLEVSDNGRGIPAIYHDKVFEKFFQIDKDFTGNVDGVGLGLSLIKAFVENYRGRIRLSSEEGKGSTFTIDLPPVI